MDAVRSQRLRKAIRQNNFEGKLFLEYVTDYTELIYKEESQKKIDEAIPTCDTHYSKGGIS